MNGRLAPSAAAPVEGGDGAERLPDFFHRDAGNFILLTKGWGEKPSPGIVGG